MRRKRERLGRPQGPLRDEIERAHRLEEIDSADAEQSLRECAAQLSAAFQLDKLRALDLLRRESERPRGLPQWYRDFSDSHRDHLHIKWQPDPKQD